MNGASTASRPDGLSVDLPRRLQRVVLLLLAAGLVQRAWLLSASGKWGPANDHFDNIGMGVAAQKVGLFKVYSLEQGENPTICGQVYDPRTDRQALLERKAPRVANYPPLGITLYWIHSRVLALIDPSLEANTLPARLVMSFPAVIADLLAAIGIYLLVLELAGKTAAIVAASLCWLAPPLAMDSAFWGQTDSWFIAPGVWCIWAMLRSRWALAGVLAGLAAMLKPQGILLGPVILFACAYIPADAGQVNLRLAVARVARFAMTAAMIVAVIALPWTIADGLSWLRASYLGNLTAYPLTTMNALNLWYLDALSMDVTRGFDTLDSRTALAGISKDTWSRGLTLGVMVALAVACGFCFRRHRRLGVVLFAGLWLWSIFIFPTRVHERYIVYCIPLIIACAVRLRWLIPALAVLMILGTAEVGWNVWMRDLPAGHFRYDVALALHDDVVASYRAQAKLGPDAKRPPPPGFGNIAEGYWQDYQTYRRQTRGWEYLATIVSLMAYAWAVVVGLARSGGSPDSRHEPTPAAGRRK